MTPKRIAYAIGALALAALLGYGFGRYATPAKVETKVVELTSTSTEWRDRDVERRVEGPVRIVTVTKSVPGACPGEPEVTTTVTEDRGQVVIDRVSDEAGAEVATRSVETVKTITADQPRLMLQAGAISGLDLRPTYVVSGSYRFAGPLWLGAAYHTDKRLELRVSLTF